MWNLQPSVTSRAGAVWCVPSNGDTSRKRSLHQEVFVRTAPALARVRDMRSCVVRERYRMLKRLERD